MFQAPRCTLRSPKNHLQRQRSSLGFAYSRRLQEEQGELGVAWTASKHIALCPVHRPHPPSQPHLCCAARTLEACDLSLVETQDPGSSAGHSKGESQARQAP